MKTLITFLAMWAVTYVIYTSMDRVDAVKHEQKLEASCIARLINVGIERKDIGVKDGKCWIDSDK